MKIFLFFLTIYFFTNSTLTAQAVDSIPLNIVIEDALNFSVGQSLRMAHSLDSEKNALPRSATRSGTLQTCSSSWWTSGFFPGTLWYLYEYSGNDTIKKYAEEFSDRVKGQQFTTDNHDVGFIINCSFGNGYRITRDSAYRNILKTASTSLLTRYRPGLGVIRSWNTNKTNTQWQYAVIIDNMMNLELLMKTAAEFNERTFSDAAISHANKTLKNHFRSDFSSYHVVSYDTLTGLPQAKQTAQGYTDNSAWARGQAWGLYGFTMMYRFTKDSEYLKQAMNIADFIIHHQRLPEDKIPYWDFDAPNIPDANRDASAGAIICSALVELSGYVPFVTGKEYRSVAEQQIRSLSGPYYRNRSGENANFLLAHSVSNFPSGVEIDAPLPYADYYFVEALMRMKHVISIQGR